MGKVYPEEVRNKAVELYRLDEETSYAQVGRDLGGIPAETIRNWVLCRRRHKTQAVNSRFSSSSEHSWSSAISTRNWLLTVAKNRSIFPRPCG